MELKNLTEKAHLFFDLLPEDWQDAILPFWDDVKESTQLYVFMENSAIVAGGLVFTKCPPDLLYYEKEAKLWFAKGYLYLGFIFVDASQRNRKLGSLWLDKIKEHYSTRGFWLATEEENLHNFYNRNGFEKVATITNDRFEQEYIYIFKP